MEAMIKPIREDTCLNCGKERSVELYDKEQKPVRYTFLLDSHKTGILVDRKLSHFQCRSCGKVYGLDWVKRDYPKPLYDINEQDFLRQFIHAKPAR